MESQKIPIVNLRMTSDIKGHQYSELILENEIKGIQVEHFVITNQNEIVEFATAGYRTIYLFVTGNGTVIANDRIYEITPETIFLPIAVKKITIKALKNKPLHYLKISSKLTEQDKNDLKDFPIENTQNVYYKKFSDCQAYTEPIKSPNTISRTILPNKYIPRVAMGTVRTKGPDEVGAHEHPMLEQLFLGLSDNNCVVYADEAKVDFPQHSVVHIPLGSKHSVSVAEDETLYYVWMDFFLDKKGEEWLKTHIVNDAS